MGGGGGGGRVQVGEGRRGVHCMCVRVCEEEGSESCL